MKKRDIKDLIRIFEHVNGVQIKNKLDLIESTQKRGILNESRKTEELALNILNNKNIKKADEVLNKFKEIDESNNQNLLPIMAFMYSENTPTEEVFKKMVKLVKSNNMKIPEFRKDGVFIEDNLFSEFLRFSEFIDGRYEKIYGDDITLKRKSNFDKDKLTTDETIFDKNGIKIYDANDQDKCIRYTQGGVSGKIYSFCIGQYVGNMYQSYRDTQTSSFYFLVDSNRDFDNDPLHIVVVDHTANGFLLTDATNHTGDIAEYGKDVDGYFNYLRSKGVDTDIFKHRPKSDEEKEEDRLLGRQKTDLEWFVKLSYNHKYKYIGRGHELGDEQFKYIWDHRKSPAYKELVNKYLNRGLPLNITQFQLLTSSDE